MGHQDVVQWFFDHGADPNLRGSRNFSVLASAVHENSTSVLELLLAHGAELDSQALYSAMNPRSSAGIPIMKFLIDQGIDINAAGSTSRYHFATPLHYAVALRNVEQVTILLEAGANRTVKDHGKTPADKAKEKGLMEIFELLTI
jgi:ankyrin repeat protein